MAKSSSTLMRSLCLATTVRVEFGPTWYKSLWSSPSEFFRSRASTGNVTGWVRLYSLTRLAILSIISRVYPTAACCWWLAEAAAPARLVGWPELPVVASWDWLPFVLLVVLRRPVVIDWRRWLAVVEDCGEGALLLAALDMAAFLWTCWELALWS